jgi:hypothetical protein
MNVWQAILNCYEQFSTPFKSTASELCIQSKTKTNGDKGMLDLGTIVTAAVVVASPFIFMGYVKFLVRRAEAHATKPTANGA